MARIGIDAVPISLSGKGVSRRISEFLSALSSFRHVHEYFIFVNQNFPLSNLPRNDAFYYIPVQIYSELSWEQVSLWRLVKKHKIDLLHSPSDRLPILSSCAMVAQIPEIPDYRWRVNNNKSLYAFASNVVSRFLFPITLKNANQIIVSSFSTKKDLQNHYDISPSKMHVVYEAAGNQFFPGTLEAIGSIRAEFSAPSGYILHFSSADPRDNTQTVLRAYKKARFESKNLLPLVIACKRDSTWKEVFELCEVLKISQYTFRAQAHNEKDLIKLYQGATIYFDPSLFEGFGLQLVEAMACGIPVIASNSTSIPEVVGDAGLLSDPNDIDFFAEKLIFLQEPKNCLEMKIKCLEQARKFSWEKHANEIMEVYKLSL